MPGYSTALYLHLLSLLIATGATTLTGFAALQLRMVNEAAHALQWARLIGRVARVFPAASLGLLTTGAFMTYEEWRWTTPWIDASTFGLVLILILGGAVERGRGRALVLELERCGMSAVALALIRDPIVWSARATGLTLLLAIVLEMTVKPTAVGALIVIGVAVLAGLLLAVPLWYTHVLSGRRGAGSGRLESADSLADPTSRDVSTTHIEESS